MRGWTIRENGKKYRVGFWKFVAYHALKRVECLEDRIKRLENKLDEVLNQKTKQSNGCTNSSSDKTK